MTDLRDAAKLALKVLENKCDPDHEAITALKRALAEDAMDRMAENARELGLDKDYARGYVAGMDSQLFASDTSQERVDKAEEQRHEQQCPNCASLMEQNTELDKKLAEWVGLTDEERRELRKRNQQHDALMLATEKLLKEKNT
mgnify:CR=1 FL=1